MSNKQSNVKQHSHYIPKTYYEPAMLALKIFCKDKQFNKAVDIAYGFYTADPSSNHYISPSKFSRNTLAKHLLKWISNS